MTCKLVILGRRKDGLTHDDYIQYLKEVHVPYVDDLLGLQQYQTMIPAGPDAAGYDELSLLWFEDPSAVDAALSSAAGQRVLDHMETFVNMDRSELFTVDDEMTHRDLRCRGRI
jgi:hypothetical protein